jgi:hypothetical protein
MTQPLPEFSSPRENALVTYDREFGRVAPVWGENIYRALHQLAQEIKEA